MAKITTTMKLADKARKLSLRKGEEDYHMTIRSQVRGLWRGYFDFYGFLDNMFYAIQTGFQRAWYEGLQECGLTPEDMTLEERQRLDQEIDAELRYITGFAVDISSGSRDQGGLLRDLMWRVDLWQNRYVGVRELAKTYACGDRKLKWIVNPIKEHCRDCLMLDGKVYRASVWKDSGWAPRSRTLACGGFKCGCYFEETNEPITPGVPPQAF